jgi:gas vesicle protein
MSNNRSSRFLSGVILGAAAGAIAGLLAAPRPGQETRRQLKKTAQQSKEALPNLADDLTTVIQIQSDRLSETARQSWDDTLLRLKDAIAAGIAAGIEANQSKYSVDDE